MGERSAPAPARLRFWQRLGVRLAGLFALVTLVAVGGSGFIIHERQKREVEDTLGAQLLNIARTASLVVDANAHAEVQRTLRRDSQAYRRVREELAAIRREGVLPSPVYTLAAFDPARRQARIVVTSDGPAVPGELYPLADEIIEPLTWTFEDGFARFTRIYRNRSGVWITAFAPIPGADGRTAAVLNVDYPVDLYLDRLRDLRTAILQGSAVAALVALVAGLVFARQVTRPISALTAGVGRVAGGDLGQSLPVRSSDEVGHLTHAFNAMVEGLRQRDFIRATFGRYVSPEVVKTLLESPEGLRLGGAKRIVTILMSDLRGYTRFAERGDPAQVMEILNGYLARMTDVVVEHGGTVNEFIGDAVFAIFGAPLAHPDHAERAAAAALAMMRAMDAVNAEHRARGFPRFEMGIGINTGEAVVGNIGSEQRAKYAAVGNAVNTASRVESATVGGQVLISAATYEAIRDLAEVSDPIPVEVKGLSEPLVLYELRALAGRFAQRLPESSAEGDRQVDVALPARCWTLDGKVISKASLAATVVRLGPRGLELRVEPPLPPLTNLKLRVTWVGLGQESGELYGKVVGLAERGGDRLSRVRLTSIDPADEKVLAGYVEG
jgi:class 3 adenylate cyclase